MDNTLLKDIDGSLKNNRYSTRTEFIRDAIRKRLSDLEKEEVIRKLAEFKGALKGKARMSEKKAGDIAFRKIAKKHGINLD
jgi:metal-responsive CopG/Arc/MetJ family transcriptional regulator